MKRIILVILVTAGFVFVSKAQEKKEGKSTPPAAVSSAFRKAFSGASKVKWEKEKSDYEVGFRQHNKEMSALYDIKGSLKETEEVMKVAELPKAALDYVKTNYKNAVIKEAAKITKAGGQVVYEAEVNKKDLIFDTTGKFLKVEAD